MSRAPPTRSEPVVDVLHGHRVADPFRWLEDASSADVQAWIASQDGYTRTELGALPHRDALARRFRELLYVESVAPPAQRANRLFYFRTHPDREKAILYWTEDDGPERVLLDPNRWSPDGTTSLGVWVPSWDGRKVAFQRRPHAADEAVLHVVDVDSGEWSTIDVIIGAQHTNPSWTPDSAAFYYERQPVDRSIPSVERVSLAETRLHRLGEDPNLDVLVHPATKDPGKFLSSWLSRDGTCLVIYVSRGWSENDVYVQRLGVDADFRLLASGKNARYMVNAWGGNFYILTDEGAPLQRVFKVAMAAPDRDHWVEIVPEDPIAVLENAAIVGGHLALRYLKNASSELRIVSLNGDPVRNVELPSRGVASDLYGLPDVDEAYFAFSSFTVPPRIFKTRLSDGHQEPWSETAAPVDGSPYEIDQVWYPSQDGTQVSMFLLHRRGWKRDARHPTLLFGYGGFMYNATPGFVPTLFPWLEAGGVYAVANIRGGGEYGSAWHQAGVRAGKQTVFDDFIAAAEYLHREGITDPAHLAISGGSNGGLLVGAVMTQRPELFSAVVCSVPLLDMIRYHHFGVGSLWVPEYGSADCAQDFEHLFQYSPYHHVDPSIQYPPVLILSADHDDRVDPLHARKFVAALQATQAGEGRAYLRVERDAGHLGADQTRRLVDSRVDQYAWLMHLFGMAPPPAR